MIKHENRDNSPENINYQRNTRQSVDYMVSSMARVSKENKRYSQ